MQNLLTALVSENFVEAQSPVAGVDFRVLATARYTSIISVSVVKTVQR